jgi:hypothetical protein
MDAYIAWVKENPLWSAACQFGLLGTIGEVIAASLRARQFRLPGKLWQLFAKVLAWALLGIVIKYGFAGMRGFLTALIEHNLLPSSLSTGFGWAFSLSVLTNILFGPQMMFFHRLEDNLIDWKINFTGLTTAWWTLLWFWIPAHTVTFILPPEYQIGLAAVWSVALGVILGLAQKRANSTEFILSHHQDPSRTKESSRQL